MVIALKILILFLVVNALIPLMDHIRDPERRRWAFTGAICVAAAGLALVH